MSEYGLQGGEKAVVLALSNSIFLRGVKSTFKLKKYKGFDGVVAPKLLIYLVKTIYKPRERIIRLDLER